MRDNRVKQTLAAGGVSVGTMMIDFKNQQALRRCFRAIRESNAGGGADPS